MLKALLGLLLLSLLRGIAWATGIGVLLAAGVALGFLGGAAIVGICWAGYLMAKGEAA